MSEKWKLKRTTQCEKCPWRVEVDPYDIPNGYSKDKHCALDKTIARPDDNFLGTLGVMACHETNNAHCVGWLVHQLGAGNNIGLRLRMLTCENVSAITLRGEQHATFEETLPSVEAEHRAVRDSNRINELASQLKASQSELARERERHQELRPFVQHKGTCPAGWPRTCVCAHARTQHFDHSGTACAHCTCKKFTVGACSCGLSALLEPKAEPAVAEGE